MNDDLDTQGNGHDPGAMIENGVIKGAIVDMADLKREDGIIAEAAEHMSRNSSGVLQRAMTAIVHNKDYRQELKTAYFLSVKEQNKFAAAISETHRYGFDLTPIVDLLITRSAGERGGRLQDIFKALTHTTMAFNYSGDKKKHFWQGDKKSGSPISD